MLLQNWNTFQSPKFQFFKIFLETVTTNPNANKPKRKDNPVRRVEGITKPFKKENKQRKKCEIRIKPLPNKKSPQIQKPFKKVLKSLDKREEKTRAKGARIKHKPIINTKSEGKKKKIL